MGRAKIFHGALIILAASLLVFALNQMTHHPKTSMTEPTFPPVQSNYVYRIAGLGIIEPKSKTVSIGTDIEGIISAVYVQVGDHVKKNDPLFALDSRQVWADIAQLVAQLESARIAKEEAATQLAFYAGIQNSQAISKETLSNRQFALQRAEADYHTAQAQLAAKQTLLQRMTIQAPIDGEILAVNALSGELASATAMATPLIAMGNTSVMHLRVEIDESDAQRWNPTLPATGTLRSESTRHIPLQYVYTERLMHPKQSITGDATELIDTRVMEVVYAFDNALVNAYSGQQMDVFIEASPQP